MKSAQGPPATTRSCGTLEKQEVRSKPRERAWGPEIKGGAGGRTRPGNGNPPLLDPPEAPAGGGLHLRARWGGWRRSRRRGLGIGNRVRKGERGRVVVRVGKKTTGEEVRRSTRRSPPWCVAMGAGQGHGRDRLSSLREKMYGYRMPLPARRLPAPSDYSQRNAVDQVSFSCPFLFRACAALRLPSLVGNNGGLDKFGTGSLVWRDKK